MRRMIFFITCLLLQVSVFSVFCMHEVEKDIFLREVSRIGKDAMVLKLYEFNKSKKNYTVNFSLRDTGNNDLLHSTILTKIKTIEASPSCFLDEIVSNKRTGASAGPNNYIFSSTRYWHREDILGKYIQCIAAFSNIEELTTILYHERLPLQDSVNGSANCKAYLEF